MRLLKKAVLKFFNLQVEGNQDPIKPEYSDYTDDENDLFNFVKEYTMTSKERVVSLSRAVDYISKNNIEGDIVECGVWRGGSMMVIAKKLIENKDLNRKLFLYDTFEGMSEPTKDDISLFNVDAETLLENEKDKFKGNNIWCYASLEDVRSNLRKTEYNPSDLHFVEGKVEDTLPKNKINKISILRLDTDWYESTKTELEYLYDKLTVGGILIIDDYGHWSGAKKAVDEFIEERDIKIYLSRIDYTGRIAVKLHN